MEILAGFAVAVAIGLTGVGGGVLTVPILVLFFDVPSQIAVGTALAFSALVKLPATQVYLREKQVDFRVLRTMLVGGVPGVILGSILLERIHAAGLRHLILALVGGTIAITALVNLVRLLRDNGSVEGRVTRLRAIPWLTFPIGLEVGFSSAGAGALGTLVLLYMTALPTAAVVGTDLLFGLIVSSIGAALHVGFGQWNAALLGKLLLGGIPGAFLGARFANVIPSRPLRFVLLAWLVYLGSTMLSRGWQALTG